MSWSFPPRGVVPADGAVADYQFDLDPSFEPTYECTNPVSHGVVECHPPEVKPPTPVAFASLGDCIAAIPDAYDWYTVHLTADFPVVPRGTHECEFFGIFGGCSDPDGGDSSGSVDGVSFVASYDGHALGNTGASPTPVHRWKIPNEPDTNFSFVLCPAPAFAVPDAEGNEAGSVLFTRAQLEALDVTFTYGGYWGWWDTATDPHPVTLTASVTPYNEVEPSPAGFMCLL